MTKIVEVKDLVKKYRKSSENAVDGVSFSIDKGDFFTFLGPNGAGKTTTISILTTTLSKTSGKVVINGFDLDKNSDKVRQSIGIIFQNPSLDQNLTAEENIRFHACLYGIYQFYPFFNLMPEAYKRQVMELSEVLDIKNDIFKPIKTFSGGMKRKLEIVRSLIHRPKILFLDEPTIGLDPLSRRNLWQYIKLIRSQNKTTVFLTTHYLEEAEGSDKVAIINKGKIIIEGTPAYVKNRLVKNYLEINSIDQSKLKSELDNLNLKYEINGTFKVFTGSESVQSIIKNIKTPLDFVRTHVPTLEEAYLEVIDAKS